MEVESSNAIRRARSFILLLFFLIVSVECLWQETKLNEIYFDLHNLEELLVLTDVNAFT